MRPISPSLKLKINSDPSSTEKMKICTKCRQEKGEDGFYRDKQKTGGFYSSCKDCYRERMGQKKRPDWWGHEHLSNDGYIHKSKKRMHRVVMENFLGRKLKTSEHVHHINGEKSDNRIENLQVIPANEHHRHHYEEMEICEITGRIKGKKCVK